jgi:hypothetical protein
MVLNWAREHPFATFLMILGLIAGLAALTVWVVRQTRREARGNVDAEHDKWEGVRNRLGSKSTSSMRFPPEDGVEPAPLEMFKRPEKRIRPLQIDGGLHRLRNGQPKLAFDDSSEVMENIPAGRRGGRLVYPQRLVLFRIHGDQRLLQNSTIKQLPFSASSWRKPRS